MYTYKMTNYLDYKHQEHDNKKNLMYIIKPN